MRTNDLNGQTFGRSGPLYDMRKSRLHVCGPLDIWGVSGLHLQFLSYDFSTNSSTQGQLGGAGAPGTQGAIGPSGPPGIKGTRGITGPPGEMVKRETNRI